MVVEPTSAAALTLAAKTVSYVKGATAFWDRLQPTLKRKIVVKLEKQFANFSDYLNSTYDRTTTVQLICSRATKSYIGDVYVSCSFRRNTEHNEIISDSDMMADIRFGQRTIVRGDGGSGKTLFMKKLWQSVYIEPMGKIPVFVELRNLNDLNKIDLITLIRHTLSTKKELSEDLFVELARDGLFLFILDGFDEVSVENRETVERQILDLDRSFKNCSLIVSSRPNETFIGWKTFYKLDVMPFDIKKTHLLVGKAPIDKSVIDRFHKLVDANYFKKHEEFLSSPLLALMMLLTLKQKGEISDNLIDFYDNAFHALYSEHDAIKEMFKRPHCMSISDFKLVFSTFCMFSYYKEKFDFKESEIFELIEKSIRHVNLTKDSDGKLNCSPEEFLYEMCDSISLLRKDGTEYVFNHRSFQEFFTANWIINIDSSRTDKLFEDFALRPGDNVISLSYQMNKPKVDKNYIIPFYERMLEGGFIFKSKSQKMPRWSYVEGYSLSLTWHGFTTRKDEKSASPKNRVLTYPSWDNGEVGVYYSAIDKIIFNNQMQARFSDTIKNTLGSIRPQPLIEHILLKNSARENLTISVRNGKFRFYYVTVEGDRSECTSEIELKHPKFYSKVEGMLDVLDNMLHDLNKMVNNHIALTRVGHEKSNKSLDEMFFD